MISLDGEWQRQHIKESGFGGYTCRWSVNRSEPASPERLMEYFKKSPERIFPFKIVDQNSAHTRIQVGNDYMVYPLVFRGEPVKVTDETDTSFTFLSLPGHIHGPGAGLRFSILTEGHQTVLQQEAFFRKRLYTPAVIMCGAVYWRLQARNLSLAVID